MASSVDLYERRRKGLKVYNTVNLQTEIRLAAIGVSAHLERLGDYNRFVRGSNLPVRC